MARVSRVAFSDSSGPFVILALGDELTAMGPAEAEDFDSGCTYRFLGRWEDDPQRGYRFRFSTFVVHGLHSRGAVVKYLTDNCEGIGSGTAARLWNAYGTRAVEVLRDEPFRAHEECKINYETAFEAAVALQRDKAYQHTKIDLNGLFAGRGFSGKLIDQSINVWGAKAAEVIRRNPFRLLGLVSAGFKRCDKLYLDCGLRPDALKRQAIAAAHLIETERDGHTWIEAEALAIRILELIPSARPIRAIRCALRAGVLAKLRDAEGRLWLTTAGRDFAERMIADAVARLSAAPNIWPTSAVPVSQTEGDKLPSAHQVERLGLATRGPVGIFAGGPGTGKTHTLAYLLRAAIAQCEGGAAGVVVVAPTGKAALRARDSLDSAGVRVATSTIHSLLIKCGALEMRGEGLDDGEAFGAGTAGKHDYKFVVVDESSMIDTNLMARLLASCPTGAQILFVGDPFQLPPVGHGSPLRDMIAAGLPYGELLEVRRNAGMIVEACRQIKDGVDFETTTSLELDAIPPRNLRLINSDSEAETVELLERILRSMTAFDPTWETQIIIARNKGGMITRKELNGRLQSLLNGDGYEVPGNPFRINDKIICLKNCKQHAVAFDPANSSADVIHASKYQTIKKPVRGNPHELESVEVLIANGEIGRVVAIGPKVTIARFSDGEHLVRVPMGGKSQEEKAGDDSEEEGRGGNFDLAYAVTCHKMQGSESPCTIVLADPQGGGVASREWWYTAVSRASKVCLLIGQKGVIDRQRIRQSTTRRKTFLVERLGEVSESTQPVSMDA